jgi:hypothetical protein
VKEHRLVLDDGRVVVAEGPRPVSVVDGDSWLVYMEDDPGNWSLGALDGLVVAELLGYGVDDDYPELFDKWVEQVKAS